MIPPHYRPEERDGAIYIACWTCLEHRTFERRLVCSKYLAYVSRNSTCDSWRSNEEVFDSSREGWPTPEEEELFRNTKMTSMYRTGSSETASNH